MKARILLSLYPCRAITSAGSIWAKDKAGRITTINISNITPIEGAARLWSNPAIALETLVPNGLFVNSHHLPLCGSSALRPSIA